MSLKAKVQNGRIVLDEPTDLPEGTEIELVYADHLDALDAEDRRRLRQALAASEEDVQAGRVRPAEQLLDELRRADR